MKKFFSFIPVLFIILFIYNTAPAQLSGTKTIPGDYATITAAITALNTSGVGSGGVTFNVTAGYTEFTSARLNITATGTSSNPIVFQKFGSGANPLLKTGFAGTSTPGSATPDGIWSLQGADYVTIDGIDLQDTNTSNPGTMEYGYGLFKNSVTDGAQYNTIKNCTVTLNRINNASGTAPMVDGSVCILVTNSLPTAATTALVITASTGSNSYNKFYTNTLQNSNYGVVIYGYVDVTPFTLADFGNDIGGTSAGQGNQILNYGGGASTNPAAAIRTLNQQGLNVSYNTINNNNGSGVNHATTLRGIYTQSGTSANITITYNTITLKSAVTTSQVSVIENGTGATSASNTINISNNTITNCTNDLTTTGIWYGIYNNAASAANLNITYNTFSNNVSKSTSGATYLIYNNAAVTSAINITNNNLSVGFNNTAAYTGTLYSIYNSSGTTSTNVSISSNNFSNYSFGTYANSGSIYFVYNTNSSANLTLNGNTFTNLSLYNSGTHYLLYNSSSTQVALNVNNNSIVTAYTRTLAAGTMYCYYSGSSALGTSTQTYTGNNFSNITANVNGAGTFYGLYSSDGSASPYPKKTVYNNTLSNITYKTSGTFYAIYMSYFGDGSTTAGSSIYNNTVSNILDSGTTYCVYPTGTASPSYAGNVYGNNVNNINSVGISSSVYAYYLGASTPGLNFYKNKAYNITASGTTGQSYGIYTLSAYPYNIYNNFIGDVKAPSSSPASAPYLAVAGIYLSSGTTVNVMFNTVYLNTTSTGTNFSSTAVYGSTGVTSINLQNNIFTNLSTPKGAGFSIAYQRSGTAWTNYATTSNNNDFYAGTPGTSNLICYDGTNSYQTIASYKTAVSPRDNFSFSENPNFLSTTGSDATYLHINPATASQIESGGVTISTPNITDDYDGNARYPNSGYPNNPSYPATAPDIGADEYAGIPLDMNPPVITYTPLTNTGNTNARTLTATITDASGVPTSGIGLPVLYWKKNSGSYSSVTSTSLGSNQYSFTFGSGVTVGDTVYYYVCAQDLATTPNVGSNPAGGSGYTANPPAATTPPTPNNYLITQPPLSGDYTVGLTMFNRVTGRNIYFEKVVNRVTREIPVYEQTTRENPVTNKIIGTKKVEVEELSWIPKENGRTYDGPLYVLKSEQPGFTYPQNINGIYATITAAVADLAIRGVSGATRFLLNDASYTTGETYPITIGEISGASSTNTVTIKPNTGVNASISGSSTSAIFKLNGADYVTIDGSNTLSGTTKNLTVTNTASTGAVVWLASLGTGAGATNDAVKNSNIVGGAITSGTYGIFVGGTSIGTAGDNNNNTTLQNNSISKAYVGIYAYANSTGPNSGLNVLSNYVGAADSTVSLGHDGIMLSYATGAIITGNTVYNIKNTNTTSVGITLSTGVVSSTISNNLISTIKYTGTGGYGSRGMYISTGSATCNLLIYNNMISKISGDGYSSFSNSSPVGIYIDGTNGGMNIYYNSVYMSDTLSYNAATITTAVLFNTTGITGVDMRNNIFQNTMYNPANTGAKNYAIYSVAAGTAYSQINFNDYYAGGTQGVLGYLVSDITTLSAWATATGKDGNSVSGDPKFISNTDLHINSYASSPVSNAGTYIASVLTDFDGNTRSVTTPDIGADEYAIAVPTLISPANNSVGNNLNLNLVWTKPSLAVNYNVVVATDTGFTNIILNDTTLTDSTSALSGLNSLTYYYWKVRAKNAAGTWAPFSGVYNFKTLGSPTTVVLSSPVNGSLNQPINITFNWFRAVDQTNIKKTVKDAGTSPRAISGYRFDLSTDSLFGSYIVSDSSVTDTAKSVSGLNYNTKYYWRVSAKSQLGWGSYSSVWNLTTFIPLPSAPVLVSPSNNSTGNPVSLNLVWNKSQYADLYNVVLATDAGFSSVVLNDSTLTDSLKSVSGLSTLTGYYWKVRAKNSSGWGSFSSAWMFTTLAPIPGAPTLISPAYNSTGNALNLNLVWTKPSNSTNYNVVLATDTGFTSIVLNDSTLTDSIKAVSNLSPLTYYYWKVRAKSVSGWSAFSSPFVFRTIGTASQVTLNSPANNSTGQPLSLVFNWFKAVDMTNIKGGSNIGKMGPLTVSNYWFELATDAAFTSIISRDSSLTDTTKSVSGLSNITTYYWRVKAKNQIGWGTFSSAFNFTTIVPIPNAPALVSPLNNSTGNPVSLNLVWNKPQYATGYNVVLATDAAFTTIILNDSTLTDSVKAVAGLNSLTTYYWKVRAKNVSGWGSFSSAYNFKTVGSATQVTLYSPANNAVNQPVNLTFNWFKAFDQTAAIKGSGDEGKEEIMAVSNYWFELSTDSSFATVFTRDTTLTDSVKTVSGLNNNTSYYWRVKAKNQIGWGSFSATWKFTTIIPVPSAPLLISPANGSTGISLTPTITWNTVPYASTYRIQVSTDSNFATTQWDSSGIGQVVINVPAGRLSQNTKYYWRVNASNINGTGGWSTKWNFTTLTLYLSLNLKVYLEGFWDGSTHVSDTVYVYLAGATTPHAFVDTAKVVLSGTGTASMNFNRATAGSYFIVVQHRNHLQTWSAAAQTFVGGTPLSYDFTTAATQAYGSNMKQVGSAWVLYGGDPNIDGSIDAIDIGIFVGQFGTQGYLSCDFNGDGDVNASDVQIIAANFGLTVAIPSVPPPGPDNSWRKKMNVNDIQNAIKNNGKEKGYKNNKNNN